MQKKQQQKRRFWQRGQGIYLLPNLLTSFALFSGFYASIAAIKGRFEPAALAIFIAMLMDSLDGRVARLTKTQTNFGAQYDSLSDMLSFGMAPALLVYCWGLAELGKIGWLIAFSYTACVALRLAYFNVQHTHVMDNTYFRGMPCTACAGVIAGSIWVLERYKWHATLPIVLISAMMLVLAVLMVSRLHYYSFKSINLHNKVPFFYILLVIVCLVLVAIDPPNFLFSVFFLYACSGPCVSLMRYLRHYKRSIKHNHVPPTK